MKKIILFAGLAAMLATSAAPAFGYAKKREESTGTDVIPIAEYNALVARQRCLIPYAALGAVPVERQLLVSRQSSAIATAVDQARQARANGLRRAFDERAATVARLIGGLGVPC